MKNNIDKNIDIIKREAEERQHEACCILNLLDANLASTNQETADDIADQAEKTYLEVNDFSSIAKLLKGSFSEKIKSAKKAYALYYLELNWYLSLLDAIFCQDTA